jgi:hypothetical protein
MSRACSTNGGEEECIYNFGGKDRRKETTRKMRENSIKMGFKEIGWGDMDWIDLPQDRVQWRAFGDTVMNLRVPQIVGKFLNSCATGCFSRTQLREVSLVKSQRFISPPPLTQYNCTHCTALLSFFSACATQKPCLKSWSVF